MRSEQKYIIDKEKISWRILDGEAVILNLDNGFYYSLNKVGTQIWELLAEKENTDEIIDIIADEYKADRKMVKTDLTDLFCKLKEEALIKSIE